MFQRTHLIVFKLVYSLKILLNTVVIAMTYPVLKCIRTHLQYKY